MKVRLTEDLDRVVMHGAKPMPLARAKKGTVFEVVYKDSQGVWIKGGGITVPVCLREGEYEVVTDTGTPLRLI